MDQHVLGSHAKPRADAENLFENRARRGERFGGRHFRPVRRDVLGGRFAVSTG
ncbi:hypothetical protein BZL30_2529 [Mycobacterium kansasii]|uniref:Uncharacterized protein n=1 Tax=Mycobacterium kansasii TaxID=1768 RepID=A0A1V3XI71_MYCKA|nr:hypothetical protein BZL30_2529 [Mycobacterium kansasii]OOK79985.1 hypothetical protein BZL29_2504 [Mycobacterium kansasii]